MSFSIKAFALAMVLLPVVATAAPKKRSNSDTIAASISRDGSNLPEAIKTHLSLFGMFDLADSYEVSGGQKADSERTFVLGANYEFNQFTPGIAAQIGGTYDFAREIKNSNGLKVSEWTAYGELTAKVTSSFKVMGGLNFNFPSFSNAADGASIKGKVGFQIGATYQFAPQFAFDARYRQLEMDITGNNGQGGTNTRGVKISGFMLGGRYIF